MDSAEVAPQPPDAGPGVHSNGPGARKAWSTPRVILSTIKSSRGLCLTTQTVGQVDHKNTTTGSTSVHS